MEILKEIGSYAGLAAVFGLAVLSALYFSQARDVRRLRDWAGRAPERASEQAVGGRAPVAQPARTVAPAQPVGSQTTKVPAATERVGATVPGGPPGSGPAAAAALGRTAAAQAAARQATARPATTNGPGSNGPRGAVPRLPGGQTSILAASAAAESQPWYRRLPAGRYLALMIAGVLIVGGGVAYGVSKYLEDDSPAVTERTTGGSGDVGGSAPRTAALDPASINVAVLNGTSVAGLARTEGDKVEAAGFQLGNVDNAIDKQRAESVVMFAPGRNREARLVSRRLGISQIEPADAEIRNRATSATVIVVVGADRAQSG